MINKRLLVIYGFLLSFFSFFVYSSWNDEVIPNDALIMLAGIAFIILAAIIFILDRYLFNPPEKIAKRREKMDFKKITVIVVIILITFTLIVTMFGSVTQATPAS